jgi:hypothetical protein
LNSIFFNINKINKKPNYQEGDGGANGSEYYWSAFKEDKENSNELPFFSNCHFVNAKSTLVFWVLFMFSHYIDEARYVAGCL